MQMRIESSRWRTRLTTQPVRRYLLDGEKSILMAIYDPWTSQWCLTYLSFMEVSMMKSQPGETDCRLVSTMNLQEHQLEIQLESPARRREQWPAQQQGAQPGTGCTTLRSKQGMNLWGTLAGGRGDSALPLSDTKTQRPAIGARPFTWTMLLESCSSTHKQEGWRQRMETNAVMSSKTLLQWGSNTKPSTDKVTARVKTDSNELSNINGHQQQQWESLATPHVSPQEKLKVKYVLLEKFSHCYKELA